MFGRLRLMFCCMVFSVFLLSCGGNLQKAVEENSQMIDECVRVYQDASKSVDSASSAAEIAELIENTAIKIDLIMKKGQEISEKYPLDKEQSARLIETLNPKVAEFKDSGVAFFKKISGVIDKFKDDTNGIELIKTAAGKFLAISD